MPKIKKANSSKAVGYFKHTVQLNNQTSKLRNFDFLEIQINAACFFFACSALRQVPMMTAPSDTALCSSLQFLVTANWCIFFCDYLTSLRL